MAMVHNQIITFVYCILFTSCHLSWSFPMLSWWKFSQRRQSHPQIPRKGEHGQACRCSCNDDNLRVDRKRKAPLMLGPTNKHETALDQHFPSCEHSSTFINDDDAPTTPAKRICSDGSHESSLTVDTTSLTSTKTSNQPSNLSEQDIQELLWKEANYDNSAPDVVLKRLDYLVWDDFFMGMAKLSAMRSKDPKAPFTGGACIVDEENRIVGIGYNGFPRDCSDDCLPWWSSDDNDVTSSLASCNANSNDNAIRPWLQTQSPYVCHAEVNAILNKCSANVEGARLYVAQFPCNDCAKVIIQSRIKEVVYMDDTEHLSDSSRASRIMFTMAGVTMRQYQPLRTNILLDFASAMAPPNAVTATTMKEVPKPTDNNNESTVRFRELILKEAGFDPTNSTPSGKRTAGVLSWDDWFMAVAFLSAKRSKDPNTQVGACIVDGNKRIVGLGYNGFPRGCSDDFLPWARTSSSASPLHTKYLYVCHAEVNAILNKGSSDVKGATLYVALFPCNDCAKVIIQAGIRQVVYLSDQYHDTDSCRASRIMFAMAGVQLRQHIPSIANIMIELQ